MNHCATSRVWRGSYVLMPFIPLFWTSNSSVAQPALAPPTETDGATIVYVARRGWHIDIGLAAADLPSPLDSIAKDLPEARYVFFGFGDKHYLLAKNHSPPVLLSALWPGAGIMLITGLANSPEAAFGASHVVRLSLSPEQARSLRAFLWNSFEIQGQTLSAYREGPYEDSLYYLATARYSAFHTCNTWAAQALRTAGLGVGSKGVVFAGQLWSQVLRLERTQARSPKSSQMSPRASLLFAFAPLSAAPRRQINCKAAASRPGIPPSSSSRSAARQLWF
jgi:uncharacterized protein (TIGR02117 family)